MKLLKTSLYTYLRFRNGNFQQTRCNSKTRTQISKRFSDTLNLPKTSFPLTMKDGAAAKREVQIQQICEFDQLYKWQSQLKDRETFVLHDGPPYANGDPHVGHALNKILKDITNRYKLLRGYRVHYIPGWDCHGLPIEQKALSETQGDHRQLDPVHIRHTAKLFADQAIRKQMTAFRRWGVMADWSQCYYTLDKQYESEQLEVFYQMYEKGLIYQDYMPVYWSPSSRTALAEAELEYNDEHISTAVYVKCPITNATKLYNDIDAKVYAVIWTTTPWTLPANQAICYGSNLKYSLVKDDSNNDVYLLSSHTVEKCSQMFQTKLQTLLEVDGTELEGIEYRHPLSERIQPLLHANHVTVDKGTGLVHTAPGHGQQDFQVATHNAMTVSCVVDEDGMYTEEAGSDLAGLSVQGQGNTKVLELLSEFLVHQEAFTHSYPYDWRTKQPVIIRASKQWFVDTASIKSRVMDLLSDVAVLPKSSGHGMLSQLDMRTYWCISRQRAWGVPIPVFYEQASGKPLLTRAFIDHIRSLILDHGSDCWWTLPDTDLLPSHIITQSGFSPENKFEKGKDVLDIWFDSGSSWASVLKDNGNVADVYLEGIDQFGGWFQSSLLTSVAVQDKAPYKSLVVHGFAMDEEGRKMSKSVGNVVDPDVVINGNKHTNEPSYGADVLRWWSAWSGLDTTVQIGPSILDTCNEQLFKMRKTLRYLLGNLSEFEPFEVDMNHSDLEVQDQYMLHLLHDLSKRVTFQYDTFQYSKVLVTLEKFINSNLSSYNHINKDRVYCNHKDDPGRHSALFVQWKVLEALLVFSAPILPHLAEEVFQHLPYDLTDDSIFKTQWFKADDVWHKPDLALTFDALTSIKDTFNAAIDSEPAVLFDLVVCCTGDLFDRVKCLQGEMTSSVSPLCEVLQCSTASVLSRPPLVIPDEATPVDGKCVFKKSDGEESVSHYLLVILPAENFSCERCRRNTAHKHGHLCDRCTEVLATGWD